MTVVLARLLLPSDFGLIGMIAVFSGFAALFVDLGFGAALVQRRDLDDRHLSSAFWLNVATGLAFACLLAGLAPALAAFYDEARLLPLTLALSTNLLLASMVVVQGALLQREMNFRRLSVIENASTLTAAVLAVGAALAGLGVWSLVVYGLANTTGRGVLLWSLSDWRPRLLIDRKAVGELWHFGSHLVGFASVNYWSRNTDNLLIGKFVGAAGLGIYDRAYQLMLMPLTQVTQVIGRVMFPAFSLIQDDHARVRRAYLRAIGMLSLLTFPIVVGLLVVAEPFVITVFGPKWEEVVPILQILCLAALTQPIGASVGWIYQSQARTDLMFRWGLAAAVLTIIAFAIGVNWGVTGVAVAYVVRTVLLIYPNYAIPGRLIGMSFRDVVRAVQGPLGAAVATGVVVWLVGLPLADLATPSLLLVQTAVGACLYVALVHLLSLPPYSEVRQILRERGRGTTVTGHPHSVDAASS
jgi:O-antigen/teichoic acid export membrane protein